MNMEFKEYENSEVDYISLNYDYHDVKDNMAVYQQELVEITHFDYSRLKTLVNEDPFLTYVMMVACININYFRFNNKLSVCIGLPLFDEIAENENKFMFQLKSEYSEVSFKEFLINTKNSIVKGFETESTDYCGNYANTEGKLGDIGVPMNVVVCLEGINSERKVKSDIIYRFNLEEKITYTVIYDLKKYKPETIQMLMQSFESVLGKCINNMDIKMDQLMELNQYEWDMIDAFNSNYVDLSDSVCLHKRVEENAKNIPDRTALVENGKRISYKELDQKSNSLARYLAHMGVKHGEVVGVLNHRSMYTIVSILAILKIGGAYAPIDAKYPNERINMFIDSANIKFVVTVKDYIEKIENLEKLQVVLYDSELDSISTFDHSEYNVKVGLEDTAYAIFTSGSTGTPKIAAVKHIGWANLLKWFSEKYQVTSSDKVYLISSIGFDITQRSIFMALINGAELHLDSSLIYDADAIVDYISENAITIINCAPSSFYPILESDSDQQYKSIQTIRCLFLGGEAISPQRLILWQNSENYNALISNVYGVAECSDVSSFYELLDYEKYARSSVPVGTPIYNNKLYIVDNNKKILPPGAIGEISISGIGIGKGYINDENLTKEKFTTLSDGTSVYLTGDLGKLSNGIIEFSGRKDYQVKVRGNRIELGEIENIMRQIDIVKEAVVIYDSAVERLFAVVELKYRNSEESDEDIIHNIFETIKVMLATFMLPDYIYILDKLPVNQHGKIDRLALKNQKIENTISYHENELTGKTREVYDMITELLHRKNISVNKSIFDQGVNSIMVMKLVGNINKEYGIKIASLDVYINSTVELLAKKVESLCCMK